MSKKHFPAAVEVSIGCSVALSEARRRLHGLHDVLQVAAAARQAIDAGYDQHVALAQEIQDGPELFPPSVVVPLRFSARMMWQREARSACS
jgi:hypothetical protein